MKGDVYDLPFKSHVRMRENGHHEIFLSESQILKF